MDNNYYTKDELRLRCLQKQMFFIRSLTRCRYDNDGNCIFGLTQVKLASYLHLTVSQMSRLASGVCVASAPVFFRLSELYSDRLVNNLL